MEMTKTGVKFSPQEIDAHITLFRKVFAEGSALNQERKLLSKRVHKEDESKLMDGTSSLIPELEDFSRKVTDAIQGCSANNANRNDFIFFSLNVSEEQMEKVHG